MRTANIRSLLPAAYSFDFFNAPMEGPAAVQLKTIYPGPYYSFFEQYSDADMQEAIKVVEEIVEEEDPYDGVLGFSQV